MSEARRKFLSSSLACMIFIGTSWIIYMFINALHPSSASSEIGDYQFWIEGLSVGDSMEAEFLGKPILIERLNDGEFAVWDLVSRFTEGVAGGCIIKKVVPFRRVPSYPVTAFREACRGVDYDEDGNVNPGSHKGALPIVQLSWHREGSYIYIEP